jgi:hypothetical protein
MISPSPGLIPDEKNQRFEKATVSAKIPLHQLGPHSPLYGAGAQSYRQQCVQLADGWDSLTDGN